MGAPLILADARNDEFPRFAWRRAPEGYATRRQLRAMGLRPGGQPPAAELVDPKRPRLRAELFLVALAKPKRTASPAWRAAARKATEARKVCQSAHHVGDRRIAVIPPKRTGYSCLDCA